MAVSSISQNPASAAQNLKDVAQTQGTHPQHRRRAAEQAQAQTQAPKPSANPAVGTRINTVA